MCIIVCKIIRKLEINIPCSCKPVVNDGGTPLLDFVLLMAVDNTV